MKDIESIIVNSGYLLLLINTILYASGFFRNGKAFRIFVVYLFLMILVQVFAYLLMINGQSNLYLSHVYFIGQFVLLNLFYQQQLSNLFQRKAAKVLLFLGLLLIIGNYLWSPSLILKFNIFEVFVTSLLTLIVAIFALYSMLSQKKEFYYITIGIILYLFSSSIIFFVGNLSIKLSEDYSLLPWTINAILVIVYHLFILYEWKVSFLNTKKG